MLKICSQTSGGRKKKRVHVAGVCGHFECPSVLLSACHGVALLCGFDTRAWRLKAGNASFPNSTSTGAIPMKTKGKRMSRADKQSHFERRLSEDHSLPLIGWSGRAPAPAAMEAGKGRQRQGARHVSENQHFNHRIGNNSFHVVGLNAQGHCSSAEGGRVASRKHGLPNPDLCKTSKVR